MPLPPRSGLDQRLLANLRAQQLPPGGTIVVGFSGGNDSLALAIALHRCQTIIEAGVLLVHVDHGLRPESVDEAARCRSLSESLGLPFALATLDLNLAGRAAGGGIEEQARRERYLELAGAFRSTGAALVATAHHLDDQAETVLMHLFRGAGLTGVSGMRERSELVVPWWPEPDSPNRAITRLPIWRPFLRERRSTLEGYVSESGMIPIQDRSNSSLEFRRNAIRHEVMPGIEALWPGAIQHIGQFSRRAAADDDYLDLVASELYPFVVSADGRLDGAKLRIAAGPIAARVGRRWLSESGVDQPTGDRIEAVIAMAGNRESEVCLEAGNGIEVRWFGNDLRAASREALFQWSLATVPGLWSAIPRTFKELPRTSRGNQRHVEGDGWFLEFQAGDSQLRASLDGEHRESGRIDAGVPADKLTVRTVQAGDRWWDSGRPVRDSLRVAGIHPMARESVVCFSIGDRVVHIPGVNVSEQDSGKGSENRQWLHMAWTAKP